MEGPHDVYSKLATAVGGTRRRPLGAIASERSVSTPNMGQSVSTGGPLA